MVKVWLFNEKFRMNFHNFSDRDFMKSVFWGTEAYSAWICKNKIKYCHLRSDANINIKYLVGSSIKIKWGLPSIAIAAQSFLLVPPLRSWHLFIAWACRSRSSIDFFTTWINDLSFVKAMETGIRLSKFDKIKFYEFWKRALYKQQPRTIVLQ